MILVCRKGASDIGSFETYDHRNIPGSHWLTAEGVKQVRMLKPVKMFQKLKPVKMFKPVKPIPHICHRHHRRCLCKFFLSGVKLSLLNMKMVHVFYKHCVIYRKMCKTVYDFHGVIKHLVCSFVHSM